MTEEKFGMARASQANRERERMAMRLRLGGASYQQIADQVGYANKSSAKRACDRMLQTDLAPEDHQRMRETELGRLDAMLMAIWHRCIGGVDPNTRQTIEADIEAINTALRIHAARVRMMRLDRDTEADMEEELREIARREGLDVDDLIREAEGVIASNQPRWRRQA